MQSLQVATTHAQITIPAIGEAFEGGFYAGNIRINDQLFAIVVAPKKDGEHDDIVWHTEYDSIDGAKSYFDGLAITQAMAEAGSDLAKWALGLEINGFNDWYLPAQDELELAYRHLKPTDAKNWCYARSGINLSAETPTYPYTPEFPLQTEISTFQSGGDEAFEPAWYWSSTQHASYSGYAWSQHFDYGGQDYNGKEDELRARAVRRLAI